MLKKKDIRNIIDTDLEQYYQLLENEKGNSKNISLLLSALGKLPDHFNLDKLIPFINNKKEDDRLLVVKHLGKSKTTQYIDILKVSALTDNSSKVRAEAVSSIGRSRDKENVPLLIDFLEDRDPLVVLQAIRGLLVFKKDEEYEETVREALINLQSHPNELIQNVIENEMFPSKEITDYGESHLDTPIYMQNTAVNEDVLKVLSTVPDGSLHLTFTSPPYYNARDYSIYKSYNEYLDFLENVFKEVHRITKEGRFLLVNTSPVIMKRFARNYSSKRYPIPFDLNERLQNIGWEFIDDITWEKPEASVKNRNGGFMQHRKPLSYKPNTRTEAVMVYRKKTNRLIDWNLKQYPEEIIEASKVPDGYETSNIWKIDPSFNTVHSAVFPIELCKRVIQLYSFKGDLVFDPFAGSGTMGAAALELDRQFFLTEIDKDYFDYIRDYLLSKIKLYNNSKMNFYNLSEFMKAKEAEDNCQLNKMSSKTLLNT